MSPVAGSGIPTPVAGVTGGQGLPAGVAAVDGSTGNVVIQPPNNVIQQQKGAIPQTFQVYETFTNNSNYIRVSLSATAGGPFRLRTEFAGSGVARPLVLGTGNTDFWQLNTTGTLAALTDNSYDIGLSAVNRPRSIWCGTSIAVMASPFLTNQGVLLNALVWVYGGTGVPSNAQGNNGDIYFNQAGAALTTMYQKRAGAWVGIV